MASPYIHTLRCCARGFQKAIRPTCTASIALSHYPGRSPTRRWESTAAASSSNPKISGIVDQISQLTLLETADLVSNLKVCVLIRNLGSREHAALFPKWKLTSPFLSHASTSQTCQWAASLPPHQLRQLHLWKRKKPLLLPKRRPYSP